MAATVTDILKRDILQNIFDGYENVNVSLGDSDRYYMALGRVEEWDSDAVPPVPNPSNEEVLRFQETIQSMKLISDVSFVVPRYNWTAGNVYEAYDNVFNSNLVISPSGDIQNSYYVITDTNNVYICLQQGKTSSGVVRNSLFKPTNTTGEPFTSGDDGYVWKFLFNVGAQRARRFLTSSYIPIEKILDSSEGGSSYDDLSASRQQQFDIQQSSVPGQIIGIAVDSGGTGYTSPPTISIQPIGLNADNDSVTTAQAYANIDNNGRVYEVVMKQDSTSPNFSFGGYYYNASITLSGGGGSGAKLRPIIAGKEGLGANPIKDLKSSALMFNAQITGAEGGDFQVTNDFRQIGIVRNPLKDSAQYPGFVGDSALTSTTAYAYKRLFVNAGLVAANITGDNIVTGGTTGAAAIVDYYDAVNQILYIHQTIDTGFTRFDDSAETVTVSQAGGSATIATVPGKPVVRPAEVYNFSGEVVYIDNRSPISRDDEQTEDIKIVIDL